MKRIIVLLAILGSSIYFVNAQDYKPFKFGIQLGLASATEGGNGIAFSLEPGYRISDEIALNFRFESAATAKNVTSNSGEISATSSYTLNGVYYLSNEDFRPFVGAGLGWFLPGSVEFNENNASETKVGIDFSGVFGFYPKVGFDYKHFNFIVEYNLISDAVGEYEQDIQVNGQTVTQKTTIELKNSYLGVKFGFTIAGGRN